MLVESGNPSWNLDPHYHGSTGRSGDDAKECIPPMTLHREKELLDRGRINAVTRLVHDDFDVNGTQFARLYLPTDVPVVSGIEISARIPPELKEKKCKFPRMVHVVGLFEDYPDWTLPKIQWEEARRKRWGQVSTLAPVDEVASAIRDYGGIVVWPHITPRKVPWGSARLDEIAHLKRLGVVRSEDAVELSAHWFNRRDNDTVEEFAREHNLAIVGGSDAHRPRGIGEYRTQFRKRSADVIADLKTAISERSTVVIKSLQGTVYDSAQLGLQG